MRLFVSLLAAFLLTRLSQEGPIALPSGTCWVMGNLHRTFDARYYNFMGNCTYILAKNCHVDEGHPAFEVEVKYRSFEKVKVPVVDVATVKVYGINIGIVHHEYGSVWVNYQKWSLPISLENGKVKLTQLGLSVSMVTDFGLSMQYDWSQYLMVTVPGSFAGGICGLCGNFNQKGEDDLSSHGGSVASSVAALGKKWRLPHLTDDTSCLDDCTDHCENCTAELVQSELLEKQILCTFLHQQANEILKCDLNSAIDTTALESNCMLTLCRGESLKKYYCNTFKVYADICEKGVNAQDWRVPSSCSLPKCPANSHYEFCGSRCPATCAQPEKSKCDAPCVETCACDDGFLRSGNECVRKSQCGCTFLGRYVEAGKSFWGDESCTKRYTCSSDGRLSLKETGCPAGQQCRVENGSRGCYPVTYATCMVSGDPHFVTFDGYRYNFQGTCAYQLAGVSSNQSDLEQFTVILQNNGRDKKLGSSIQLAEVKVREHSIVISRERPGVVMVDGLLSDLPMTLDNNTVWLYKSGWFAVVETAFGLKVFYDWSSVAFVMVPSTYRGAMRGLCGNFDLNSTNDMQLQDGQEATSAEELGQSWKVSKIPGCVDGCRGTCPVCNSTQREMYNTKAYCGLISDPRGPFRDCHSVVEPKAFLGDCLFDVCLYQGRKDIACKTLTAYTAACQLRGARVQSWRSPQFCDAQCQSNSHYKLCTSSCVGLCQNPPVCGAQCMEGCECNKGFLQSGNKCIPTKQCGCTYEDKHYEHGQVFYPNANCERQCTCNDTVQCKPFSCGPQEKCVVKDHVRSCVGVSFCSVSGDPHYRTFDGQTYDFQGDCLYTAVKACHLEGTNLNNFSVMVQNERWYGLTDDPKVSVAKLVAVEAYGTTVILRQNQVGWITVDDVLTHVPFDQHKGALRVFQEGINYVLLTDFGLRVTYDLIYHVTITVPEKYKGKTCGLCGDFNGNKSDDLRLPDGKVTTDTKTFGAAWKVPVRDMVCEDAVCSGDLCPKCEESKKREIEAQCAIIKNPKGPFAGCHSTLDPMSYYRDCVFDVCMANEDPRVLCRSVAAYMSDCQAYDAKVQNWRSSSFCPFKCSANSHYDSCVRPCASPCPALSNSLRCDVICSEGCACDKGFYYNGSGCVALDQCSCSFNGRTYKVGESVITDDCQRKYTCQASGVVLSQNVTCKPDELCQVKSGVMGCHLQQCSLGDNGTLTPFDGDGGTISQPGAYEIIQNCEQTSMSHWFRVVVSLEMCQPGVNTILAVYVFFQDVMIAVNYKHNIWINGDMMTQSFFNEGGVRVQVSNQTVTVSSSSSLTLAFSQASELTMSVSAQVADAVCGACGSLKRSKPTPDSLREAMLMLRQRRAIDLRVIDLGKWEAPDFPQCPE